MLQAVLWCSELCSQRLYIGSNVAASLQYVLLLRRTLWIMSLRWKTWMEWKTQEFSFILSIINWLPEGFFDFDSLHTQLDLMPDRDTWLIFRSSGDVDASFQNSLMCVPDWKSEFLVWQWWWHCVCLWAGISQMCVSIPPACFCAQTATYSEKFVEFWK